MLLLAAVYLIIMEEKLLEAAKEFMKVYFSDGKEKTPSDFDKDILGGTDILFVSRMSHRPKWNSTPFFEALGDLVDDGIVLFKQLEDGQYVYWMPSNRR